MRVVITRPLPEAGIADLRAAHEVYVHDTPQHVDEEQLIDWGQSAEALITMASDPVTAQVLAACPQLRIVAHYGAGYDNVDLDAAKRHSVIVTHTPDAVTDATADFTFALLLAAARFVREADERVRNGYFSEHNLLGLELRGKTLGIVGLGRIGRAVARRALGFRMHIIYHNRTRANPTVERETSARRVPFEDLLAASDFISIHCPLNKSSHHLFDAAALRRMKPTAFLINTARGPVVDEAALVEALERGALAGAALDVFEEEPRVHPGLLEQDRVVLAPHLASATTETRTRMARMCSEAIQAVAEEAEKIPYRIA